MSHKEAKHNSYFGNFFRNMNHYLTEVMGDTPIDRDHESNTTDYPMLVKMADAVTESFEGCFVSVPGCSRDEAGTRSNQESKHHQGDTPTWKQRWNNETAALLLMSFMPLETPLGIIEVKKEDKQKDENETKMNDRGVMWRIMHPVKSLHELQDINRGTYEPPTHDINYIVPPV